jgi:hypothetical protein
MESVTREGQRELEIMLDEGEGAEAGNVAASLAELLIDLVVKG